MTSQNGNESTAVNELDNFRNLFRQTPEMVCILRGPNHVFEFVNQAHIRVLGFDATGMPVRQAQPDSVQVHGILDEVYRTGRTAELHQIPVTVTGHLRYFDLTYAARRDPRGNVDGIMILGVEVTDQVRVREAQVKISSIFMQAPALVSVLRGPSHVFELANPPVVAQLGLDPIGKPLLEVAPELRAQGIGEILDRVYATGEPYANHEWLIQRLAPDGTLIDRYYDFVVQPIRNTAGVIEGLITYGLDVSDQVEARRRIETLSCDLAKAVKARDDFLSMASHELKTPITSVRLQVELRRRLWRTRPELACNAQGAERFLEGLIRQTDRLTKLVEDLLDISRITNGQLRIESEEVDLLELVSEVAERFSVQSDEAGCSLRVVGDPSVRGIWDRYRIEQVLINLLTNAIRYGAGKPIEVDVSKCDGGKNACLAVRDRGIGIAQVDLNRIFGRFERATGEAKKVGLGLGLHISKQIVEAHGGRISVSSQPGSGSTFTVVLPVRQRATQQTSRQAG